MGLVNIDDDLHDSLRAATTVTRRSINAQASYWIRIGMLCELHPTLSFQQVVAREMRAAGLVPPALRPDELAQAAAAHTR